MVKNESSQGIKYRPVAINLYALDDVRMVADDYVSAGILGLLYVLLYLSGIERKIPYRAIDLCQSQSYICLHSFNSLSRQLYENILTQAGLFSHL